MVDKSLRFEIAFLNQLILLNKIDAEKFELRDRYQKGLFPFFEITNYRNGDLQNIDNLLTANPISRGYKNTFSFRAINHYLTKKKYKLGK